MAAGSGEAMLLDARGMVLDSAPCPMPGESAVVTLGSRCGGQQVVLRSTSAIHAPLVAELSDVQVEHLPLTAASGTDLLAIYDTDRRGLDYSLVPFLVRAEVCRQEMGLAAIRLIVLGSRHTWRGPLGGYACAGDCPPRQALEALAAVMPTVPDIELVGDRAVAIREAASAGVFSVGDDFGLRPGEEPTLIDSREAMCAAALAQDEGRLSAPSDDLERTREWLDAQGSAGPIYTVTMSPAAVGADGGMEVAAWAEVMRRTRDIQWVVVGSHDAVCELGADRVATVFPFGPPTMVQALYEMADLNLSTYGLHALPILYGRGPFAVWVPCDRDVPGARHEDLRARGVDDAGRAPFLREDQRLILQSMTPERVMATLQPDHA